MSYTINAMHQSTQLLYSTVRVHVQFADGSNGVGTAFFFDHGEPNNWRTYLVTNKHVVDGAVSGRIVFHTATAPQLHALTPPSRAAVDFADFEREWFPHPDSAIDLCVMSVEHLKDLAGSALDALFYRQMGAHGVKTDEELGSFPAITNVAMIGYPIGLWDEQNNLPLIRMGTTASHPAIDFDGHPQVVIDMACFPGSSGSPVVFYAPRDLGTASHYFLGVLHAGPVQEVSGDIVVRPAPVAVRATVRSEVMIHLGYVIKGREVVRAIEALEGVSPGVAQPGCSSGPGSGASWPLSSGNVERPRNLR
jgi:hypothetical protein